MVLRAWPGDIPRIIDMVELLVQSVDGPQIVDRAYTGRSIAALMARDDAAVWVTQGGFLAASVEVTVISGERIAFEHGWFATDGSGLRLLRTFEKWAEAMKARPQLSTGMAGPDLSRIGYRAVEIAWIK